MIGADWKPNEFMAEDDFCDKFLLVRVGRLRGTKLRQCPAIQLTPHVVGGRVLYRRQVHMHACIHAFGPNGNAMMQKLHAYAIH